MESGNSGTSERLRITSKGAFGLNGTNYGTAGQVLASQGSNDPPQWVNTATGNLTTIKVKQDNYCGVDDSSLNPISVTPTSAGISTIGIGTTSNAYGRRFVQDNDPTTPELVEVILPVMVIYGMTHLHKYAIINIVLIHK